MKQILTRFNGFSTCKSLGLGLWECPPFLFLILGFLTIISMLGAAMLTSRYFEEPETPTVITVTFIAVLFITVGNLLISGFNKIAEASRIKSQFISIISHQLRTPVSIFKWTLESLQHSMNKPELQSDTDNSIANLLDASQKMIRLVNTLLDVTRIEARTLALQREDVFLGSLLKKVIDSFSRYADASHVAIHIDADQDIPIVFADRQRIQAVMETFIDNAIRYTIEASAITVRLKKEGSYVRFSVSDTGVGIPRMQQKYIFQKFFRSTNIMQYQTEGTGIDLFISKHIINVSGGSIGFTSQEGKGSTFWFILPIK
ncbi:MAG: HAMP domain-containing sensor histidine kinase [Candidatus Sungbacteria bacterium]|nr:HAMP domain-containing sensor histidine kinase [bacterium]MDZ4260280.1 HAMP domain-containing sensor histidine kinase [Candidatus Sungbacteria bacterium]